jgi:hypothetical protein
VYVAVFKHWSFDNHVYVAVFKHWGFDNHVYVAVFKPISMNFMLHVPCILS